MKDNVSNAGGRTVTVIGPGVRVDGNVTFKGFLRIQGEIVGDVTCGDDAQGTVVVHKSGKLTGAVKSPNLVVSGRVLGPVQSSESIEIHEDASVIGDAIYKRIDVQAGGVIDGLLTPTATTESVEVLADRPALRSANETVEAASVLPTAIPPRHPRRFGRWLKVGAAIGFIVAAAAAAMVAINRGPTSSVVPPVAKSADPPATGKEALALSQPAPPVIGAPPAPPESVKPAIAAAPVPPPITLPKPAENKATIAAPSVAKPVAPEPIQSADPNKVMVVQGGNADKAADALFVNSKEPAVLFRKKRDDSGDGSRIDVRRGAKIRVAIGDDEVFRVAEGGAIELYYQGRRVPPKYVSSGVWMSFEPLSAGAADVGGEH